MKSVILRPWLLRFLFWQLYHYTTHSCSDKLNINIVITEDIDSSISFKLAVVQNWHKNRITHKNIQNVC